VALMLACLFVITQRVVRSMRARRKNADEAARNKI
jgi:hypothetical protein